MMTMVLLIATIVLDAAGALFAGVFLWINLTARVSDLPGRNSSALRIARVAMIVSLAFAALTCLLSDPSGITASISRSAMLFTVIAVTWLAVLLASGIVMLVALVSRRLYRPELSGAVRRLVFVALPGAITGLVLMWLFS